MSTTTTQEKEAELKGFEQTMLALQVEFEILETKRRFCLTQIARLQSEIKTVPGSFAKHQTDPLTKSIWELRLSRRTIQVLGEAGIATIGALIEKSEAELLALDNSTIKTVDEIKIALAAKNLPVLVFSKAIA